MKNFALTVMFSVLLLAAVPAAQALEQYWTAEAGFFFPDGKDLDPGINVEGGYGLRLVDLAPALSRHGSFWSKVGIEAGAGYYHAENGGNGGGDVDVIPLTLAALVRHPVNSAFNLYGGGGLGMYLVDNNLPDGRDGSYTDLAAHAIGGVAFPVNAKVEITAEVKWRLAGHDADGAALTGGVRYAF